MPSQSTRRAGKMWMFERQLRVNTALGEITTPVRFPVAAKTAREADQKAEAISQEAYQVLTGGRGDPDWAAQPVRLYPM